MSNVIIRLAMLRDAERLFSLYLDSWKKFYVPRIDNKLIEAFERRSESKLVNMLMQEMNAHNVETMVVEIDGIVEGFAMFKGDGGDFLSSYLEIKMFYVNESRQRGGVGTNLLDSLEKLIAEKFDHPFGKKVIVKVDFENEGAINFFRKAGYKWDGSECVTNSIAGLRREVVLSKIVGVYK